MPRVIGIGPGTVSIDLRGLDDGALFLDESFPTADALAGPRTLVDLLTHAGPLDLVTGPSGYGLPLTAVRDASDAALRLEYLGAEGEPGGIGGFARVAKQGAALLADGLAGGAEARLVEAMGIRDAHGTVRDYLYVISPAAARRRLGDA